VPTIIYLYTALIIDIKIGKMMAILNVNKSLATYTVLLATLCNSSLLSAIKFQFLYLDAKNVGGILKPLVSLSGAPAKSFENPCPSTF
jgi:hypothetical protein